MKGVFVNGVDDNDTEERYNALNVINTLSTQALKNIVEMSKEPKAVDFIENKHEKLLKALKSPLSGLFS